MSFNAKLSLHELTDMLICYYKRVSPIKIDQVPIIAKRFHHQQTFLFEQLKKKYGEDPSLLEEFVVVNLK